MNARTYIHSLFAWCLTAVVLLAQVSVRLQLHGCGATMAFDQKHWSFRESPQEPEGCCVSDNGEAADCCHHKVIAAKVPSDLSMPLSMEWSYWAIIDQPTIAFTPPLTPAVQGIQQPLCPSPVYAHGPPVYLLNHQLIFYA